MSYLKKYHTLKLNCCLIFFLNISCLSNNGEYTEGAISDFIRLQKEFREPSKEYKSIPFFWPGMAGLRSMILMLL